ncbi:LTA synthase family protein [Ureibacillus aquaedulcis]|uniref:LTA synthase family protein n=1 Tax=Ureibacillus aquaedulcis TaxID=3058421 RepID=A0ABT8GL83_9BACL|nr:LTA synthase family protein [Ureibacillus sp. BA0131]MDN4492174.1 LTA synthase family protein [Ureibacillus sp. BA0131]
MIRNFVLRKHPLFFIFTAILFLKFIFTRSLLFEGIDFFQTLFVELCYLFILFGLIELIPTYKVKKIIYLLLDIFLTILLTVILVYHNYFGYIVTIHAFSLINQIGTIRDSIFQLIEPIYVVLYIDFIIFLFSSLLSRKKARNSSINPSYRFALGVLLLGTAVSALLLYTQKDVEIANSVTGAKKQGILTYEIFGVKKYLTSEAANQFTAVEIKELPEIIEEVKEITPLEKGELRYFGAAAGKNIIAIQMEAFQDFALNAKINGQPVTPFLDSLKKESVYFPNLYQQIGPGNTSDAEFIFNTSLYPRDMEATSETYGNKIIPSFPKLLKEKGYTALTFHANDVSFWNRDELYPALGFNQYYDKEFFGQEDVIGIGPSDEVLYTKALPELKKLYDHHRNFFAHFITLSGHHPFQIPDDKNTLNLPESFNGNIVGDYLKAVHYTDEMLGKFVAELKEAGMWEDTMLVLYGDHFGLQQSSLKEPELALLEELLGHDYHLLDQLNVPLMITVGDEHLSEINETIGGQVDILPTVSNLLGLPLDYFVHFGQDLINYPNNLFGMRYYMPTGSFFNNDIAYKPNEGFEDGEAFDIRTLETVQDYMKYEADYQRIKEILQLSDQYLNSLPEKEK